MTSELIHLGQFVLHEREPIDRFIHATFAVPTRSEAYKYAAYDGSMRLDRARRRRRELSGELGASLSRADDAGTRPVSPHAGRDLVVTVPDITSVYAHEKDDVEPCSVWSGSPPHLPSDAHSKPLPRARKLLTMMGYDVIVIGAGSAGSVLAGELVAAGARVLLLEAGGPADAYPQIWDPNQINCL